MYSSRWSSYFASRLPQMQHMIWLSSASVKADSYLNSSSPKIGSSSIKTPLLRIESKTEHHRRRESRESREPSRCPDLSQWHRYLSTAARLPASLLRGIAPESRPPSSAGPSHRFPPGCRHLRKSHRLWPHPLASSRNGAATATTPSCQIS